LEERNKLIGAHRGELRNVPPVQHAVGLRVRWTRRWKRKGGERKDTGGGGKIVHLRPQGMEGDRGQKKTLHLPKKTSRVSHAATNSSKTANASVASFLGRVKNFSAWLTPRNNQSERRYEIFEVRKENGTTEQTEKLDDLLVHAHKYSKGVFEQQSHSPLEMSAREEQRGHYGNHD
jgi:hypothetical protein